MTQSSVLRPFRSLHGFQGFMPWGLFYFPLPNCLILCYNNYITSEKGELPWVIAENASTGL